MARERVITRTVLSTKASIMCLNIISANVEIKDFDITPATDDKTIALKVAKKLYETDTFKLVNVDTLTQEEQIYGMREVDFIRLAQRMDGDRHFIDEDNEVQPVEVQPVEVQPVEVQPNKSKNGKRK